MMFSSVDLPQPDGPTSTVNSPLSMSRSMPFSTSTGRSACADAANGECRHGRQPSFSSWRPTSPRRRSGRARTSGRRADRPAMSAPPRSAPRRSARRIAARSLTLALSAIRAAVIGCCVPVVKVTPYRNSFQMPVNCQMTVTIRIGGDSGRTMRQNDPEEAGAVDPRGLDQVLRDGRRSSCGRTAW